MRDRFENIHKKNIQFKFAMRNASFGEKSRIWRLTGLF